MGKYHIKKETNTPFLIDFWESSVDRTIFTHPFVLPKLVDYIEWWMVFKGDEPLCLWPICAPDFRNGGITRLAYYVGPLWSKKKSEVSRARWFEISKIVYRLFMDAFKDIPFFKEASFPLSITDIREFMWMSDEVKPLNNLEIVLRYTAIINNLRSKKPEEIFDSLNKKRKKELTELSKKTNLILVPECKFEEIYELYGDCFKEKGFKIPEIENQRIRRLFSLITKQFGYIYGYRDTNDNSLVALELVLHDNNTANGVLNLCRSKYKDSGAPTGVRYYYVLKAKELGLDIFDFNGANSSISAFYKHSMGAEPLLYFDLKFHRDGH